MHVNLNFKTFCLSLHTFPPPLQTSAVNLAQTVWHTDSIQTCVLLIISILGVLYILVLYNFILFF